MYVHCIIFTVKSEFLGHNDIISYVPPSCPPDQPLLPIYHQPKQNRADGGTTKITVNPT